MADTHFRKVVNLVIQEKFREKGLNINSLANRTQVTREAITHILKGDTKNPGIMTIFYIAEGLGMGFKEFIDEVHNHPKFKEEENDGP